MGIREKRNPFNEASPAVDLKSIIDQNSLYFDKLVELIPAKFYLPVDELEKPWFQGLSKGDNRSVTYEELRQRLHCEIEELRGGRNAGSSDEAKGIEKSEKKGIHQQQKRKRESGSEEKKSTTGNPSDKVEKDITEASKELAFSHVKIGNEDKHGKNKKRKFSKV
ncbi:hypothetical protein Q3G72_000910 [Acer saccharum]|nr:hypothetical protein Q3G72_000910 [Acer saccharum]